MFQAQCCTAESHFKYLKLMQFWQNFVSVMFSHTLDTSLAGGFCIDTESWKRVPWTRSDGKLTSSSTIQFCFSADTKTYRHVCFGVQAYIGRLIGRFERFAKTKLAAEIGQTWSDHIVESSNKGFQNNRLSILDPVVVELYVGLSTAGEIWVGFRGLPLSICLSSCFSVWRRAERYWNCFQGSELVQVQSP